MSVGLIWAQATNGVIGAGGRLPWDLPEDLARFRALTLGSTVLMGRRTWQSLPDAVRPLPGRRNVVLSRSGRPAPGAAVVSSLAEALDAPTTDVWVIGGAAVYRAALELADRVEVTTLNTEVAGDVFAPRLGPRWRLVVRDPDTGWHHSRTGLLYSCSSYTRTEEPAAAIVVNDCEGGTFGDEVEHGGELPRAAGRTPGSKNRCPDRGHQ